MVDTVIIAKLKNFIRDFLGDNEVVVPTTGQTVSITKRITVLNPSATLASLTIAFPTSPADKTQGVVCTTRAITSISNTSGANTVANFPSSMAAGASFSYLFVAASSTWVKIAN